MLEGGRPFVVEVKEPRRRDVDVATLAAEINRRADGRIEVEGLRRATHTMVERVKELEASKTYVLTVRLAEPVSESELAEACEALLGETVSQRTPNRVDHRRADIVRTRAVYSLAGPLSGFPRPPR